MGHARSFEYHLKAVVRAALRPIKQFSPAVALESIIKEKLKSLYPSIHFFHWEKSLKAIESTMSKQQGWEERIGLGGYSRAAWENSEIC